MIDDRNILDKFCEDFCNIINEHCRYIIVSGFFAIASGRTRGTEDIDLIMEKVSLDKFKEIFSDLIKNDFECMHPKNPEEAYEYLIDKCSIRFTRKGKELPEMEIKFAKDLLDEMQFNTREKYKLTGLDVWFSSVNTGIAFKEELLKSPKDLEDAKHLRVVYAEKINDHEIKVIKQMIRKLRL
jgi:hypothetical protein